jgi:acetyl esterase
MATPRRPGRDRPSRPAPGRDGYDAARVRDVALVLALTLVLCATASVVAAERAHAQGAPPTTAPATSTPKVTADVEYGAPGNADNTMDAYIPQDGKTGRAAVIMIHGGGWVGGVKAMQAPDALFFAAHGIAAFSISYSVNGPDRWPTQLEDAQRAVRFVQDNASTYGIDPAKVGVFGSSAGGNLAMLVGADGTGDGHPPVKAVSAWSGPSDLTTIAVTNIDGRELATPSTVPIPGAETPVGCVNDGNACIGVISPNYLQLFMGCTINECPDQYRDASPALQVTSTTPPMYLATGVVDLVPREQAFEMANALSANGIASEIQQVAGTQHADSMRGVALQPTFDFFTKYLVDGADPHVAPGTPPTLVAGSVPLPPVGPDGTLPVPAIPDVATRTGIYGWVWRHRLPVAGGAALVIVLLLLVLGRRRSRSAR